MSADLQLLQDFPKIHLRTARPSPESSQAGNSADDLTVTDLPTTSDASVLGEIIEGVDVDVEICRTPRSEESKIPAVVNCPPAPRKPRRSFPCKRKSTELQFFEIVNREEVDEFFRTSFEFSEISRSKKRSRSLLVKAPR